MLVWTLDIQIFLPKLIINVSTCGIKRLKIGNLKIKPLMEESNEFQNTNNDTTNPSKKRKSSDRKGACRII